MCTKTPLNEEFMCLRDIECRKDPSCKYLQELRKGNFNILQEEHLWTRSCNSQEFDDDELLCFAIANLLCFIRINFTGPQISDDLDNFLKAKLSEIRSFVVVSDSSADETNANVKNIELISVARRIFDHYTGNDLMRLWWKLRVLHIQQVALDDVDAGIYETFDKTVTGLEKLAETSDLTECLKAQIDVEIVQSYLSYSFVSKARARLENAQKRLNFQHSLLGELGKRTKFQQTNIAQLLLDIKLGESVSKERIREPVSPVEHLEAVALNDEVRLEETSYVNETTPPGDLPQCEQTLLLAHVVLNSRERPQDELEAEETKPYISFLLSKDLQDHQSFCVRLSSLYLRSKLEMKHKRTVERTLMQTETIVKTLTMTEESVKNKCEAWNRVDSFWGSFCPPIYECRTLLATVMLNLGLVKASLDLFLSLEKWEDVLVCYTILEQRHLAEEVIKQRIAATGPTVKLLCLLGDATDDETCYSKAWELSKGRSPRAQRHWALHLFSRKQYVDAIPHMRKSLELNGLQVALWSRLGYAALTEEDWETAAWAYRHYTALEMDSFEAWNNLAKAYIKLGDKARAHRTLNDALRCNYDNWKVWDNFLVVSASLGKIQDCVRAYHRLLDLKEGKHLDLEVLEVIVQQIVRPDELKDDESARKIQKNITENVQKLFGRISSSSGMQDGRFWELYSCLAPGDSVRWQRLQKAYRSRCSQKRDWHQDPESSEIMLKLCLQLGGCFNGENEPERSSTRLILRTVVTSVKKNDWENCRKIVEEVEGILSSLTVT